MIVSRPVMTTLSRLAMVYSVIEQIRQSPAHDRCREQLRRLNSVRRNLKIALLNHNFIPFRRTDENVHCDGIVPDVGEHNGRLHRFEVRFTQFVKDGLPDHIDARMWLSAVLAQCETQHNEIPVKHIETRAGWSELIRLLSEIYAAFDPELEAVEEMRTGADFGESLKWRVA